MPRRLPPRYDLPHAAPEPLRLVQLLLNTRDHEHGREWLGSPAELRRWLDEHDFRAQIGDGDLKRVRRVREALRELTLANNDHDFDPGARDILEREAKRAPLRVTFAGPRLVAASRGVEAFLAQVFAVVHDAMRDGTWVRLKSCRNCHWAFYDESKNRSATWCSMELCGNRLKTKRYRTRRRRSSARPVTAP
jgi:predicted RNA-binding Zn ribbon-like protein